MVTLVFVDYHTERLTVAEAMRICGNPELAGYVVDALTPDRGLQNRLRVMMDKW